MRRSTLSPATVLLAVPVVFGAGCATIERYEVRETERVLAAAGFRMRVEDAHDVPQHVRSMPPHRIVTSSHDGNVVYVYADPTVCRCVYVGGDEEYAEYERLRVQRQTARRTRESSPSGGAGGGAP